MSRSIAALMVDQAKLVTDVSQKLADLLSGVPSTPEREVLLNELFQALLVIKTKLQEELTRLCETSTLCQTSPV